MPPKCQAADVQVNLVFFILMGLAVTVEKDTSAYKEKKKKKRNRFFSEYHYGTKDRGKVIYRQGNESGIKNKTNKNINSNIEVTLSQVLKTK